MKILLLILLSFTLLNTQQNENVLSFDEKIHEGYNSYYEYYSIEQEDYKLTCYIGELNNQVSYSLYFKSQTKDLHFGSDDCNFYYKKQNNEVEVYEIQVRNICVLAVENTDVRFSLFSYSYLQYDDAFGNKVIGYGKGFSPNEVNVVLENSSSSFENFYNQSIISYEKCFIYSYKSTTLDLTCIIGEVNQNICYSFYGQSLDSVDIVYYSAGAPKYRLIPDNENIFSFVKFIDKLEKDSNSIKFFVNNNLELTIELEDLENLQASKYYDSEIINGFGYNVINKNDIKMAKYITKSEVTKSIVISIIVLLFITGMIVFYLLFKKKHMNECFPKSNDFEEEKKVIVVKQELEEKKVIDDDNLELEKILIENNINPAYSLLSTKEKDEVMLKLMILRNKNIISNEQYQKEVIKLWS